MFIYDRYEAIKQYCKETDQYEKSLERRRQTAINKTLQRLLKEAECKQHDFEWLCSYHDGSRYKCRFCGKVIPDYKISKSDLVHGVFED